MSTLSVNEITSQSGNTITVPSGKTFIAPGHIIQAVGVKQGTATAVVQVQIILGLELVLENLLLLPQQAVKY